MKFKEILKERLDKVNKDLDVQFQSDVYYLRLKVRMYELEEILRIYEQETNN